MLLDNENLEMPDDQLDPQEQDTHPTPPETPTADESVDNADHPAEEPSAIETPATDAEAPSEEEATPVREPITEQKPISAEASDPPPVAEEETPEQEVVSATPEAESEAPVAEVEPQTPPTPEGDAAPETPVAEAPKEPESAAVISELPADFPPFNPELEARIKEIVGQKGAASQILSHATVSDLIHILQAALQTEEVMSMISRVNLAKRTYDAHKYKEPPSSEHEEMFMQRLAAFNHRRVGMQKHLEDTRAQNLTRKRELLVTLKEVVDAEDPQRIREVRALQDAWREIGQVPKANLDELYTQYRSLLDKFYKLREMHLELLEYDRKINLTEKNRLIAEAKAKLIPEEGQREDPEVWREKMDLLSELQQQWKSVGHVPREEMDRINNDYRAIIDEFFEIRQSYRAKLDELRQVNADQKEAILKDMELLAGYDADKPRAWNDANRQFRELQETYKGIGQAPQGVNGELWARYREVCNVFYGRKAEFFRKYDEIRNANLEQKRGLVERAEGLTASGEWEKSARELKRLQREWREIGPVPERYSNKLWNRFRAACDTFFESRRAHYNHLHAEENENLEKKKGLIAEVRKLIETTTGDVPGMIEQVKGLQRQWREIGKVPYKEKDKIWDEFRSEVDSFFNGLPAKRSEIREKRSKVSLETITDQDERGRVIKDRISGIRRKISRARETITQYLENMDRIARGKSGDALRKQIQDKIDSEEQLIATWRKQIKDLNEALKNPPPPPAPEPEAPAEPEAVAPEPKPAEEAEASTKEKAPKAEAAAESQAVAPEEAPQAEASAESNAKEETKAPAKKEAQPETPSESDAEVPQAEDNADKPAE